jgi:hypothetical protein
MLVRNHLLCPYSDCEANKRSEDLRIQVIVNDVNDKRTVRLEKTLKGEKEHTSLPYKWTKEVYDADCPYCQRPVEVVIDETHSTRYIHLRQKNEYKQSKKEVRDKVKYDKPASYFHSRPKAIKDMGAKITELMSVPDPEEFTKLINQHVKRYRELDQTYLKAIENIKKAGLNNLSDEEVCSILRPYLLQWGKMGRVLGHKGCRRTATKLKEIENKFNGFQNLNLATIDISQKSDDVEELYEEILNAEWKSEKGRTKRVGPTATAKVLHLIVPDLFMIWDRKIRVDYGFGESGKEYVRFLINMQNWIKKLNPILEEMQKDYGKSPTKLVDDYNWIKCWAEEKDLL